MARYNNFEINIYRIIVQVNKKIQLSPLHCLCICRVSFAAQTSYSTWHKFPLYFLLWQTLVLVSSLSLPLPFEKMYAQTKCVPANCSLEQVTVCAVSPSRVCTTWHSHWSFLPPSELSPGAWAGRDLISHQVTLTLQARELWPSDGN